MKHELLAKLNAHKERSAWGKGVIAYAIDMLTDITDEELTQAVVNGKLKDLLLNGAENWNQYSWGGSALIYDQDIAERLCAPWELKRTRNGERRPNAREEWLDVQARALRQAYWFIRNDAAELQKGV